MDKDDRDDVDREWLRAILEWCVSSNERDPARVIAGVTGVVCGVRSDKAISAHVAQLFKQEAPDA